MGDRGSKSVLLWAWQNTVKEQRADGSSIFMQKQKNN